MPWKCREINNKDNRQTGTKIEMFNNEAVLHKFEEQVHLLEV